MPIVEFSQLSLVEVQRGSALIGIELQSVLCHKEPARASKAPYQMLWNVKYTHWGVFCLPLAGSLWYTGDYNSNVQI